MTEPTQPDGTGGMDAGREALAWIRGALKDEAEWIVPDAEGFTWWSSRLRTRTWSEVAGIVEGAPRWHVGTRTPVFRDVEESDAAYAWLSDANTGPWMGAWVLDPEAGEIGFRCGATFSAASTGWMSRWLFAAMLFAAGVPHAALGAGGTDAWTVDDLGHPEHGRRTDPHRLHADLGTLGDRGRGGPPIPPASLRRLARELAAKGAAATYVAERDALMVAVPFGSDAESGWGMTTIEDTLLGWGLTVRQGIPRRFGVRRARWIANALNVGEAAGRPDASSAPALGAWRADEYGQVIHDLFLAGPTIGALDGGGEASLTRILLDWAIRRAAAVVERLPWLETAASARYPDDPMPDLPPAPEESTEGDETPVPYAERGFGPRARARRAPSAGPRTDPPRTLLVDAADPAAYVEIDAAVAAAEDGDTVRVRPGTYRVPVVVDRAVAIVGDGPPEAIILEAVGGESIGFGASGGSVRGLTIRPALVGNDGLACSAVSVLDVVATVDDCRLTTHLGATAWIGGSSARVTFRDCRFEDGSQNAVFVVDGARVEMARCVVRGHRWPITVNGSGSSLRIAGCTIEDNFEAGVAAGPGTFLDIRDSRIEGNAGTAIELVQAAPSSAVEGCAIVGNGGAGVAVRGGVGGRVRGNRLERNVVGILAIDGASPSVEENEFYDHTHGGIGVFGDFTRPRVTGNTIHTGRASGVVIRNGASGTYEGNHVAGSDAAGIWVDGKGTSPTVRGNVVAEGTGVAISVSDGARGTFEANDLRGNAGGSWDVSGASELLSRSGNLEDSGTTGGTIAAPIPWSPPDPGTKPRRTN